MLGKIICDNGKIYPLVQLQRATVKSIESTRKEGNKYIWDLVVTDKDKQLYLAMPDVLKENYSFLRALETGKRFLLELGTVKSWNGGSISKINLRNKYRQIVTKD